MSTADIRVLTGDQVRDLMEIKRQPYTQNYLAMYSTWFGGVVTDPMLMCVPIDDHLVHRGDGIFEAIKCVDGRVYALTRHLERLEKSAELVHLTLPMGRGRIIETILATIRVTGVKDCLIRLYISRGPGGFTTNPYECVGSQLYLVITGLRATPPERLATGVTLKTSSVPVKEGYFANVKSCNYLANVLMKKEALDAGVDFTVSLDEQGFLAEGSTENCAIVTSKRELLIPSFKRTLRGITVTRTMELARPLVERGELSDVREADIRPEQAYQAAEILLLGTTLDVMPVGRYDGHVIGESGKPGPIGKKLLDLMRKDLKSGPEMVTAVYE